MMSENTNCDVGVWFANLSKCLNIVSEVARGARTKTVTNAFTLIYMLAVVLTCGHICSKTLGRLQSKP